MLKFGSALAPTGVVQLGSECHTAQQISLKRLIGKEDSRSMAALGGEATANWRGYRAYTRFLGHGEDFPGSLGIGGISSPGSGVKSWSGCFSLALFTPHYLFLWAWQRSCGDLQRPLSHSHGNERSRMIHHFLGLW